MRVTRIIIGLWNIILSTFWSFYRIYGGFPDKARCELYQGFTVCRYKHVRFEMVKKFAPRQNVSIVY
jgi:hypothetical protein